MSDLDVECRFCTGRHRSRFLCDPAKRVLDALIQRGMSFNMPTIEFPDPVQMDWQTGQGGEPADVMVQQIVVQAAMTPVVGIARPALVFTGRDAAGSVLPRWIYPGDDADITAVGKLVTEMAEIAVRGAAKVRRG